MGYRRGRLQSDPDLTCAPKLCHRHLLVNRIGAEVEMCLRHCARAFPVSISAIISSTGLLFTHAQLSSPNFLQHSLKGMALLLLLAGMLIAAWF
jgi:hypothetical protein